MTTARVALFDGRADTVEIRELPVPDPGPDEAVVRVLGCTLCGSDLHTFSGRRDVAVPTILGHEIVGEIVAISDRFAAADQDPLRVGDRVTWAIVAPCGACFYCRRELPQKCLKSVKYGHERFVSGREWYGGLAEYCLLAPGTRAFRVPAALPLSVACPASCATATVVAALAAAGDLRERSVCILGAGMLGLTAAAMTRSGGARHVVCVDPQSARREAARSFGATAVAAPDELAAIRTALALDHGFDAVFEVSGANAAFEAAWPHVRLGGTIVLVGAVFPSPAVPMVLEQLVRRNLAIRGVHNYAPAHLAAALAFLDREHRTYPFDALVSAWFPLHDVSAAFTAARVGGTIRIGVSNSR